MYITMVGAGGGNEIGISTPDVSCQTITFCRQETSPRIKSLTVLNVFTRFSMFSRKMEEMFCFLRESGTTRSDVCGSGLGSLLRRRHVQHRTPHPRHKGMIGAHTLAPSYS